ncbi:hypothetical protein BV898_19801, partial [Hypsibius exemplaris]
MLNDICRGSTNFGGKPKRLDSGRSVILAIWWYALGDVNKQTKPTR